MSLLGRLRRKWLPSAGEILADTRADLEAWALRTAEKPDAYAAATGTASPDVADGDDCPDVVAQLPPGSNAPASDTLHEFGPAKKRQPTPDEIEAAYPDKPKTSTGVQLAPGYIDTRVRGPEVSVDVLPYADLPEFFANTPVFTNTAGGLLPPDHLSDTEKSLYHAVLRDMHEGDRADLFARGGMNAVRNEVLRRMADAIADLVHKYPPHTPPAPPKRASSAWWHIW